MRNSTCVALLVTLLPTAADAAVVMMVPDGTTNVASNDALSPGIIELSIDFNDLAPLVLEIAPEASEEPVGPGAGIELNAIINNFTVSDWNSIEFALTTVNSFTPVFDTVPPGSVEGDAAAATLNITPSLVTATVPVTFSVEVGDALNPLGNWILSGFPATTDPLPVGENRNFFLTITPVPEPGSLSLLAVLLVGGVLRSRSRR